MSVLNPDDLAELIELARVEGINSVGLDPAQCTRLPGAWIRLDNLDLGPVLAHGHTLIHATVHLMVAEQPILKALGALSPLLERLTAVLPPAGPVTPTGVLLPGTTAILPALAVPIAVTSTPPAPDDTPEEPAP